MEREHNKTLTINTKPKLLIISDTPNISSGLSRCVRELVNGFSEKFDIAIAGWHHVPLSHNYSHFIYPLEKGTHYEHKQLMHILNDFKPQLILSIGDMWDFSNYLNSIITFKEANNCRWIIWVTVDGENLSKHWKPILKTADEIVSFSDFGTKEIKNVYDVDVDYIYPGVDANVFFETRIKDLKLKNEKKESVDMNKVFAVMNLSQNTDRKNIPATIEAFSVFAKDKDDVMLFLVTDPYDPHGHDLWDIIKREKINKKVLITNNSGPTKGKGIDDKQLNLMYGTAKVLLLTSIGEGLGFPIIEGMACGTIPISTDYASVSELITDGRGKLIEPSAYLYGTYSIKRAIISQKKLIEALNVLYNNWKHDNGKNEAIVKKCKSFVAELTWEKTINSFLKIFDKLLNKKERSWVKTSIQVKDLDLLMVVPSWGKNCGIAEYSKELISAIKKTGNCVNVYPNNDIPALLKLLDETKYNTIHIQHEFSFFNSSDEFLKLLEAMKDKRVILTMHSVVPSMLSINKAILERIDKLLVHADIFKGRLIETMATDKLDSSMRTDNVENIMMMPMGVKPLMDDDYGVMGREKLNIKDRYPIIGSFGFLREQKGFDDILLAVKILKKIYPNILLYLYTPPHEFGSKQYDETFLQWIEKIDMQNNVLMIREYSHDAKMLRCLQLAHMFILNYKDPPMGGGISAAVKTLMRTRRPILTTDSFMFADLIKGEVAKIRNVTPESLADAINVLIKDEELKKNILINSAKYITENSWDNVAKKHMEVYLS